MAYLRLLVISLISICIAKNVTRCHLTRYFIFKEQCTVNIFRFLSTFWSFIRCSKSVCFTNFIIPKIKVYFNNARASVVSSSGSRIYAIVPRLPGDNPRISVVVDTDSVAYEETYAYHT